MTLSHSEPAEEELRPPARRPRGRPLLMNRARALELIHEAARDGRMFRVHLEQPALYARARRMWGSWSAALAAAGIDYEQVVHSARRRSVDTRRTRRDGEAR